MDGEESLTFAPPKLATMSEWTATVLELGLYSVVGLFIAAAGTIAIVFTVCSTMVTALPPDTSPIEAVISWPQIFLTLPLIGILIVVILRPYASWVWGRNRNRFWMSIELRPSTVRIQGLRRSAVVDYQDIRLVALHSTPGAESQWVVSFHDPHGNGQLGITLSQDDSRTCFEALRERAGSAVAQDAIRGEITPPRAKAARSDALDYLVQTERRAAMSEGVAGILLAIVMLCFLIGGVAIVVSEGEFHRLGRLAGGAVFAMIATVAVYRRWRATQRAIEELRDRLTPMADG